MALVARGVSACTQYPQGAATSKVEEKTFTAKPATSALPIGFLPGQFTDLRIVESVNQHTDGKPMPLAEGREEPRLPQQPASTRG